MSTTPPLKGCLAALTLVCAAPAFSAPLITEFLTNNNTGILDEDGTRQDWIEIHNPDLVPVDLGGYHLTDDETRPMRWTFPAGVVLQPGEYLVVFASNKDRAVTGQPLHTNFALASGGEYLALNTPDGLGHLSEWNPYPVQSADVSYGLFSPTAGAQSVFFTTPTPGAVNNATAAPAEAVVFTPASRGFNTGTTLNVTLSVTSPTAVIRYTTNRNHPIDVNGRTGNFTADAATDVCTLNAHGLSQNDRVRVNGPVPLTTALPYYVTVLSPNTFKLCIEPSGTPVDLTGGGTFTLRRDAVTASAAVGGVFSATAVHGFFTGDPVQISTTGTLPAPLTADTTYYISLISTTQFRLSTNAAGTAPVSLTTSGTGTHTVYRTPSPAYTGPIPVTINTRVRAQAYESGRPPGPMRSEMYFALDANAQNFTSNVPVVITHTWGASPASDLPIPGQVMIFEPAITDNLTRLTNPPVLSAPCTIERRGSSTAGDPKYSIAVEMQDENEIDRNYPVLGMPGDSDWIMHAPYNFDRSLMHNDLIYRLSNDIGRYAVRTKFVEHFHNTTSNLNGLEGTTATGTGAAGDYFGVYSFMEKISRGNDRVDVENLTIADTTLPAIQGGYMFKADRLDAGETGIRPGAGQSFGGIGRMGPGDNILAWVNPREVSNDPFKKINTAQATWLRDHLAEAWAVLSGPNFMDPVNGYAKYWDVPAMLDHQLLNIMTKNADANRLSAYWHKPRFGKITAGPIWDFDRAEGSTDGRDFNWGTWRGDTGDLGTDFFHYPWFNEMFRDPNYWQMFIDRYHAWRQGPWSTAAIHARIDEFVAQVNPGDTTTTPAKRNIARWGQAPRGAGSNNTLTNNTFNGQYTGEIAWLKHWWASRLNFMDNQFTRPVTANFPSGPVPVNSALVLTSPSLATPGVRIYYTTDGTDPRLPATAPQTLYTPGGLPTIATLVADISTVRGIAPTSLASGGPTGVEWRGADLNGNGNNADDFNDSAWFTNAAGTVNGVGYDNDLATSYLPYIGLRWSTSANPVAPNVPENTMFGRNGSCFSRYVFNVTPEQMALLTAGNRLTLNIRYDDAFVAWINGTLVANSDNITAATATWNSVIGSSREAVLPNGNDFNLSAFVNSLHAGQNVLAIQTVNGTNTTSSDLVSQPRLLIQGTVGVRPPFTPALTAGAAQYTGPLTVTVPTVITARTLNPVLASDPPTFSGGGTGDVPNGSSWSAPAVFYYFPGAALASQANIQITEVHYHPSPPSAEEIANGWLDANDFEYVRLTNTGSAPVDLTGIFFSDGVEFTAAPGLQNWLPAGASVIVVENPAAFAFRYGTSFAVLGSYGGNFNDAGERVTLRDRNGVVISDFTYGDDPPWPDEADELGHSLLYVSGDQNLPASWQASAQPGGTAINSFAAWQRSFYSAAEIPAAGMTADTDGDGLNNLGEYAFVTHPRSAGSVEAATGVLASGSPPGLTFVRRSGIWDVRWVLETSGSLTGQWTPVYTAPSVTSNGNGTETVVWRLGSVPTDPRVFLRVRATNP